MVRLYYSASILAGRASAPYVLPPCKCTYLVLLRSKCTVHLTGPELVHPVLLCCLDDLVVSIECQGPFVTPGIRLHSVLHG